MKKLTRQIHLMALALAAMALVCMCTGQAFAQLTPQEQTEIQEAVAAGDTTAVEAVLKKLMKQAMADGKDIETFARQAVSAAVLAAVAEGQDSAAIAQAASYGATSGAVEAAVEMGQPVFAAAEAASFGARTGAVQAAQQTGQDVAAIEQASLQGSQQSKDEARDLELFEPAPEFDYEPDPEEPMTQDEQDPSPAA